MRTHMCASFPLERQGEPPPGILVRTLWTLPTAVESMPPWPNARRPPDELGEGPLAAAGEADGAVAGGEGDWEEVGVEEVESQGLSNRSMKT
jgi:hypothetical protein